MELLGMYIASRGPLQDRCISFHARYRLNKCAARFEIRINDEEFTADETFWCIPYDNGTYPGAVRNVNLIIGDNGSGKTSLIFFLESMIVQIATGSLVASSLFSGFSLWMDDKRKVSGKRRFYVFYTNEQPEISGFPPQEEPEYCSCEKKQDEPRDAAARLIVSSASLENRFFYWEPGQTGGTIPIYQFTPQEKVWKRFPVERHLPADSALLGTTDGSSTSSEVSISIKQRNEGGYFASQLLEVLNACRRGIAHRMTMTEPEYGDNYPSECGFFLADSIKITLSGNVLDRELFDARMAKKIKYWTQIDRQEKALSADVKYIISLESELLKGEDSFRIRQLKRIALDILIKIVEKKVSKEVLSAIGELKSILRSILKYAADPESIERKLLICLQDCTPRLRDYLYFDFFLQDSIRNLVITMEQAQAYLEFQCLLCKRMEQFSDGECITLFKLGEIFNSEAVTDDRCKEGEKPILPDIMRAFYKYLAYSSCATEDENTLWDMPELRLEASSGQINMLMLAVNLLNVVERQTTAERSASNILLIDEADLSYHPEWQRCFIYWLLGILHQLEAQDWHVMIATHSPILIGDVPRANIIRLKLPNSKGSQSTENRDETFAQNIYRIYQNEMCLRSAMGEFTRQYMKRLNDKMNDLKKDQNDMDEQKKLKEMQQMVLNIGDPVLRQIYNNRIARIREERIIKRLEEKGVAQEDLDALKRLCGK